jgi:T5SS/PEP-CTERM-associated repeat protein
VDGGSISTGGAKLGDLPGSAGSVTVTGIGSLWTSTGVLQVGNLGNGTLTVADGAEVVVGELLASQASLFGNGTITATSGAVLDADLLFDSAHGNQASTSFSTGGILTVTANGGTLGAGYRENGTLTIAEGIIISSREGYLGYHNGSAGAATVTGTGSKWTTSSNLYVGNYGDGVLTVESGAQVNSHGVFLGYRTGATGLATVSGESSRWDIGINTFHIGYRGDGELTVNNGAQITSVTCYMASDFGSTATALITGTGSKWTNVGQLSVGVQGHATLTVADGGEVETDDFFASLADLYGDGTINATRGAVLDAQLQFDATHGTQQIIPFGSGGTLIVNVLGGELGVGYQESGSLTVAEGRNITSNNGYLGHSSGANGTATVSGAGSKWTSTSILSVGYRGTGTLSIEAQGNVNSWESHIAAGTDSTGSATVSGVGSEWINTGLLHIGRDGNGTLNILFGGHVSDSSSYLGFFDGSNGVATVVGAGAKWASSGSLTVGRYGTANLNITSAGLVTVGTTLTIDQDLDNDAFINMATGGMLALKGDIDDSLTQFLGLVQGTDAIRYWNSALLKWSPITSAIYGQDYTLSYITSGDLTGYTLLTVGSVSTVGDYDGDGDVDGRDFLILQRNPGLGSVSDWQNAYGHNSDLTTATSASVPEPGTAVLAIVLALSALSRRRA